MNKKIKVIDLIDKKYHNLELPKHIRINKLEYFYNENRKTYDSEYGEQMSFDFTDNVLNMEVEILEDNTEEIEEIGEISDEYFNMLSDEAKVKWLKSYIKEDRNKINELVKRINHIERIKTMNKC